MFGVPVAAMGIVDVAVVAERIMPAALAVPVAVIVMGQVRQRMLVIMIFMRRVGVAIVDEVGMALVLHAGVPAAGAMIMSMTRMNVMRGAGHYSSATVSTRSSVL